MVKVVVNDAKGLVQSAGSGATFEDGLDSASKLTRGNANQAAGTLTSKVETGILNGPVVNTAPATPSSHATGVHTLTGVNLSKGYATVTANATSVAVTMLTKAHILELFGGSTRIAVGDYIEWTLHNAGTTVNQSLVLTANTGQTVQSNQAVKVAANAADGETATVGGSSVGRFRTRVTNVDGSTRTERLS